MILHLLILLLIAPFLELKQARQKALLYLPGSFNRTIFGIETFNIRKNKALVLSFNRTIFGIETNWLVVDRMTVALLIAPFLELKPPHTLPTP